MDIRQLRYFKEIVEQGSISKAANALHMAQPPLSMLLKQLEDKYGMPLIKRYREKWEITEAGQVLYEHAAQMLHDIEMIDVKMGYIKQGDIGHVRVGMSSSCLHLVGQIIKTFTLNFPTIQLHITKADSANIERMLYANELDVAIILAPKNKGMYVSIPLASSPFALAIPTNWYKEIDANTFPIKYMEKYPFVSLESMEGYSMLEDIMNYVDSQKMKLNIVAKAKDVTLAQYLVEQGVGISILPMIHGVQNYGIQYVELPQLITKIQPMLIYKKEVGLSSVIKNFISFFE